jgi:hypothetical protein
MSAQSLHAVDVGQVLGPTRRVFVANERRAADEVGVHVAEGVPHAVCPGIGEGKPGELGQNVDFGGRIDPQTEIAGGARTAVQREGVCPTIRKRTSAATTVRNRSTKSGFIGQVASQPPELLARSPGLKDAFGIGQLHPELEVVLIGFGC